MSQLASATLHQPGTGAAQPAPVASARCQQPPRLHRCIGPAPAVPAALTALHQLGSRVGKALAPADRVCCALAVSPLTRKRAFSAVVRVALVRCRRFRRPARNQRPCARAHRSAVIPFPVPRSPAPTLLRPVLSCVCEVFASANGSSVANTQRNLAVLRKTAQGSCILGALWYFPVQGLTEKELSPKYDKASLKAQERRGFHVSSSNH